MREWMLVPDGPGMWEADHGRGFVLVKVERVGDGHYAWVPRDLVGTGDGGKVYLSVASPLFRAWCWCRIEVPDALPEEVR
jgi:hypothetical protein